MKNYTKLTALLLLAVLAFVPLQSAAAKGLLDGQVIFGQSFTLKSGETMNGDLVVFGGSATIEEGATVNGSTVLFGGNLVIDGEVTRDAAIVGGAMTLGAHAHVYGNLTTVGASLIRADGSQVDGQIYNTATSWVGVGSNGSHPVPPVVIPAIPAIPNLRINYNPFGSMMNAFGQAVGIALLAMLLMLFLAPYADRVAHAVAAQPLTAGGLGLLTVVVVPMALVALGLLSILIVTLLVTVPLMIILSIALAVAAVFGWIAIGYEIGQRLVKAMHQEWHPALAAGLGTFALTLIANGASVLNFIPGMQCITWVLPTLVGLVALGGVVMTRFGTQAVLAPTASTAVVPPSTPSGGNPTK